MASIKASANPKVYYVTSKDLPLSCPLPGTNVWNMHPRVYLPIKSEGVVVCPYCSAQYHLKNK